MSRYVTQRDDARRARAGQRARRWSSTSSSSSRRGSRTRSPPPRPAAQTPRSSSSAAAPSSRSASPAAQGATRMVANRRSLFRPIGRRESAMDRDAARGVAERRACRCQIGAPIDRDPSTVGYWVRKHGLSANGSRARSRGGSPRDARDLCDEGIDCRDRGGVSTAARRPSRHWHRAVRAASRGDAIAPRPEARAERHELRRSSRRHGADHVLSAGAVSATDARGATRRRSPSGAGQAKLGSSRRPAGSA